MLVNAEDNTNSLEVLNGICDAQFTYFKQIHAVLPFRNIGSGVDGRSDWIPLHRPYTWTLDHREPKLVPDIRGWSSSRRTHSVNIETEKK